MSSFVLIGKDDKFKLSSDRMVSMVSRDGKIIETEKRKKKVFSIGDWSFFCSGEVVSVDKTLSHIYSVKDICPVELSDFISNTCSTGNAEKIDGIFMLEFFGIRIDYENSVFETVQISQYNSFELKIEQIPFGFDGIIILAGGVGSVEVLDNIEEDYLKNVDNFDIVRSYEKISNMVDGIGGGMDCIDIRVLEHTVIGGAIVGTILAGNELRIANDTNNFTLDETGASLIDASFELSTTGGKTRITLDADVGIKIEGRSGGNWSDRFYVNTSGNVIFTGTLSGANGDFSGSISAVDGDIGGMSITSDGIDVDSTHYIHNDGEIKWGGLWLKTNGDAIFDGDIYASKIIGQVSYTQLTDIPATKVTSGTMSGSRVSGGTITWPGVQMYTSLYGEHFLDAASYLNLRSPGVGISDQLVVAGFSTLNGGLSVFGSVYSDGSVGLDRYIYPSFTYLRFKNGILVEAG